MRIHSAKIQKLLIFALSAVLLSAFIRIVYLARDLSIHEDEYQHTHLAWNTSQGKIIYRDFHDSHGPLSNFWYQKVLQVVLKDGAFTQSFYRIRYLNLFVVLLTGFLVGLNIFLLCKNRLASFLGVAVYFSSPIIASVAFRIRPDCYVGFFSVFCLFFWLKKRYGWAGFCLGLCLGFHGKFLPINICILITAWYLLRKNRRFFYLLLLGEFLVITSIGIWFWYHRALSFGFDGMIGAGFRTAFKRIVHQGDWNRLFRSVSRTELWLGGLVGLTIIFLVIRFYRSKKISWDSDWVMSATYSIAGLLFLLAPVWGHAFVFVLPIIIPFLVSALFLIPAVGEGVSIFVLVGSIFLFLRDPRKTDRGIELLRGQLESLDAAIAETKRTDPIFYIWTSRCPAYVFNSDPKPNWTQPFKRGNSRSPIRQLPPINYLSIHPMFLSALDRDEREYIQEHFQIRGCFWKRVK